MGCVEEVKTDSFLAICLYYLFLYQNREKGEQIHKKQVNIIVILNNKNEVSVRIRSGGREGGEEREGKGGELVVFASGLCRSC